MPKNSKKRSRDDKSGDKTRREEDSDDIETRLSSSHGGKPKKSPSSSSAPPKKKQKLQQAPEPESSDSDDAELDSQDGSDDSGPSGPMGNAVIDVVEGDMTSTWEPAQISAEAATQAFNSLLAPYTLPQFIDEHWKHSKPVLISPNADRAKSKVKLVGISGPNDILKAVGRANVAERPLRFRLNVAVAKWDPESDEIEQGTPDEPFDVEPAQLNDALADGFSISVFGLDTISEACAPLSDLLSKVDRAWHGEGSCTSQIDVVPSGVARFGAYAHPRDRIIVQLQGQQRMQVFYPASVASGSDYQASPDNAASEVVTHFPLHSHGPYPLIIHSVDSLDIEPTPEDEAPRPVSVALEASLSAGDVIYVPKDFIVFTEPANLGEDDSDDPGSVSLSICLSNQPSPLKLAQQTLTQLHGSSSRSFFTSSADAQAASAALMQSALAAVQQDAFKQRLDVRTKYSWKHFDVHRWIQTRYGNGELERLVDESGGLVKIRDFLPTAVAEAIHDTLTNLNNDEWYSTEARPDQSQNNIAHRFLSAKQFPNSEAIFRAFRDLLPDHEATFSAGRYNQSDHIDPHDDRAYKDLDGEIYSRYIAVIYYLTKDWTEEDGGALVDLDGGSTKFVPEFNSMVAFSVPRWHQVEAVKVTNKARLSIFGWFLKPGQLYPLDLGESDEEGNMMMMDDSDDAMMPPFGDDDDDDDDDSNEPIIPMSKKQKKQHSAPPKKSKKEKEELSVD